jgi:hypothetical protein
MIAFMAFSQKTTPEEEILLFAALRIRIRSPTFPPLVILGNPGVHTFALPETSFETLVHLPQHNMAFTIG